MVVSTFQRKVIDYYWFKNFDFFIKGKNDGINSLIYKQNLHTFWNLSLYVMKTFTIYKISFFFFPHMAHTLLGRWTHVKRIQPMCCEEVTHVTSRLKHFKLEYTPPGLTSIADSMSTSTWYIYVCLVPWTCREKSLCHLVLEMYSE